MKSPDNSSVAGNAAATEKSGSSRNEEILCPICGLELTPVELVTGGWDCRCGEFIPEAIALSAFEGCSSGLGCNCGRERHGA